MSERERERERENDRQIDNHQRERERERMRDRQTDRQTDRQQRHRHTETHSETIFFCVVCRSDELCFFAGKSLDNCETLELPLSQFKSMKVFVTD